MSRRARTFSTGSSKALRDAVVAQHRYPDRTEVDYHIEPRQVDLNLATNINTN